MTTTAPNLGRVFNGTARPATDEDIAILSPGDWIRERDNPWCYRFKKWDSGMAVGVWEGKEFLVPRQLLMVVQVLEDQVCEKFFRKPESSGAGRAIAPVQSNLHLEPIKSNDSEFEKMIEQIEGAFSPCTPQVGDAYGNSNPIGIGDRFAIKPGATNECTIVAIDGDKYRIVWGLSGYEQEVDETFFDNLKPVKRIEAGDRLVSPAKPPSTLPIGPSFQISFPSYAEGFWRSKSGLHPIKAKEGDSGDDRFIRCDILPIEEQIAICQQRIDGQKWRIQDLESQPKQTQLIKDGIKSARSAIADEKQRIEQLESLLPIKSEVPEKLRFAYRQLRQKGMSHSQALELLTS